MSDLIALKGIELIPLEVTERESEVRGILFDKVVIYEAKSIQGLYPIIVYTAAHGLINSEKYRAIKKELRDPKSIDPPYDTMGFIFEGEDEAFVILDGVKIASNDPPKPDDPIPWQVRRQTGISIIGSLASKNIDFQIFIIGPTRETADLLPEYKRFFESTLDFRKFGAEIFAAANKSGLLEQISSERAGTSRPPRTINEDKAGRTRLPKKDRAGAADNESEGISGGDQTNKKLLRWLWLLGAGVSLACFLLIRLRMVRLPKK